VTTIPYAVSRRKVDPALVLLEGIVQSKEGLKRHQLHAFGLLGRYAFGLPYSFARRGIVTSRDLEGDVKILLDNELAELRRCRRRTDDPRDRYGEDLFLATQKGKRHVRRHSAKIPKTYEIPAVLERVKRGNGWDDLEYIYGRVWDAKFPITLEEGEEFLKEVGVILRAPLQIA